MATIELPEFNKENEQSFSPEQLDSLRKKTFNSNLAGLIDKVTSSSSIADDQHLHTHTESAKKYSESHPLLKKIQQLIYGQHSRMHSKKSISLEISDEFDFSHWEFEIQKYSIENYAFYYYSIVDESYRRFYGRNMDKEYIGIYSNELSGSIAHQYHLIDGTVYISLFTLLKASTGQLPVNNRLLPLVALETSHFSDELYEQLISSTVLMEILLKMSLHENSELIQQEVLPVRKVHQEVSLLQHNFYLIPESICYLFTFTDENNSSAITKCRELYASLQSHIGSQSILYLFTQTTILLFLVKDDIDVVHNLYLSLRGPHLLLFNIDDLRGRNFLKRIYSIAYKKKI